MPLPTHTNIDERLRKSFEANMLDGDTIEDCGSSLLDAKECFEFFSAELHTIIAEERAEMVKAFGGCTECYGKGYSTVLEHISARGNRVFEELPRMQFCTCGRGQGLKEEIKRLV